MRKNVRGKGDFMGNKDKLISFLSSHYGYVTTSELLELNIYNISLKFKSILMRVLLKRLVTDYI